MRLLQIVPLYDSYRVFLRELTRALEADGHAVRTLCRIGEGNTIGYDPEDTNCRHFPLPRGSHLLRHLRALRAEVEAFRPDVVHAHFSAAALTAALAGHLPGAAVSRHAGPARAAAAVGGGVRGGPHGRGMGAHGG